MQRAFPVMIVQVYSQVTFQMVHVKLTFMSMVVNVNARNGGMALEPFSAFASPFTTI